MRTARRAVKRGPARVSQIRVTPDQPGADLLAQSWRVLDCINGTITDSCDNLPIRAAIQDIRRFIADRRGTTSVEYVVIAMGIFFAIVTGLTAIGTKLSAVFPVISDKLQ